MLQYYTPLLYQRCYSIIPPVVSKILQYYTPLLYQRCYSIIPPCCIKNVTVLYPPAVSKILPYYTPLPYFWNTVGTYVLNV